MLFSLNLVKLIEILIGGRISITEYQNSIIKTMINQIFRYYCTVPHGVESITQQELLKLGAENVSVHKGRIGFSGDLSLCYKANLCLRTANRILMDLGTFHAKDFTELYKHTTKIPWERYITPQDTISINVKLFNSTINSPIHTSGKIRHSLNDRLKEKAHFSPAVDPQNATINILCSIHKNHCSIGIDTSGDPLFKRGYKIAPGPASLKETLAAALLLMAGYNGQKPLYDPMCGSGTILVEAAMIALNIAPGLKRDNFNFMRFSSFDQQKYNDLKKSLTNQIKQNHLTFIQGSDISIKTLDEARKNITRADLNNIINLKHLDVANFKPPQHHESIIITNSPYGNRCKTNSKTNKGFPVYTIIQNILRQNPKTQIGFLTTDSSSPSKRFLPKFSSKCTKTPLFNGRIACNYIQI